MNTEDYKKLMSDMRHTFHNSVYVEDGKLVSRICLSSFQTKNVSELIWNINRFDVNDLYIKTLGHQQEALDLGLKAAQEVIAESFLSDVFLNRDGNYMEEGLRVDVSGKYPHAAIWAALVQTRIFYEFPHVAKDYFIYREKGFSVDQSVVFCQVLTPVSMIYCTKVGAHGTTPTYGNVGCNSLKKYFVKRWEYINELSNAMHGNGSGGFSSKVFSYSGAALNTIDNIEQLYDIFNGDHDA